MNLTRKRIAWGETQRRVEYLYEISEDNINRKKRLAEENKKEIMDKYYDRYGVYPDKKVILKLADPILRGYMDF